MLKGLIKRLRAVFLADAIPGSTLGNLETSWDIRITINKLKKHEWNKWDLQYLIMIPSLLFSLIIIRDPPFIIRLGIILIMGLLCLFPITCQFWFRFLPIGTWLALFFSCGFIPAEWRPSIFVRVLPALETILYGGDLSDVLASSTNSFLDILAWIPYGVGHYTLPFVVSTICFVFGPPKTLPVFAFAFGWNNWLAVLIQICFPTAPPWYQRLYGLNPANYNVQGNAGGLARIDELFGVKMYSGAFSASPLVFGAFPSLHSGFAVMEALFLSHLFPKYTPAFFSYVLWIWWSTMYLTHHYFVDLIGGAAVAFSIFYFCKLTCLPQTQDGKFARWSYDYIETGVQQPAKFRKSLDLNDDRQNDDDDEEETMFELPPIDTNFSNHHSMPTNNYNNNTHHNKTSSYHLYDADMIRSTSASSPSNHSNPMSPTKIVRSGTPDSFIQQRSMSPSSISYRSDDEFVTMNMNRPKIA